jgi:hypothetical protein
MADPKTSLLILSNSMIEALATNATVLANFGECFTSFRRSSDCASCQKRHSQDDYGAVRDCLAGVSTAKKLLLKRLLNAHKIRLDVRKGPNRKVTLTF